jgi:hypothetical protein
MSSLCAPNRFMSKRNVSSVRTPDSTWSQPPPHQRWNSCES